MLPTDASPKDYFCEVDGQRFAGTHLLVELWESDGMDDLQRIETGLTQAALAAHATVLHGYFHVFTPGGGITGVLLLAESHITIHTWPEHRYAAIDVFMCASCNPHNSLPALRECFNPGRMSVQTIRRGLPDSGPV